MGKTRGVVNPRSRLEVVDDEWKQFKIDEFDTLENGRGPFRVGVHKKISVASAEREGQKSNKETKDMEGLMCTECSGVPTWPMDAWTKLKVKLRTWDIRERRRRCRKDDEDRFKCAARSAKTRFM